MSTLSHPIVHVKVRFSIDEIRARITISSIPADAKQPSLSMSTVASFCFGSNNSSKFYHFQILYTARKYALSPETKVANRACRDNHLLNTVRSYVLQHSSYYCKLYPEEHPKSNHKWHSVPAVYYHSFRACES